MPVQLFGAKGYPNLPQRRSLRLPGFAVVCVALLATHSLFAQTGQITGRVTDPTGLDVPDALVTVRNTNTGIGAAVHTNAAGYYTAPYLVPGTYDVEVSKSGFEVMTLSGIKLDVGQIARQDVALKLGAQAVHVDVSSAAPLLQTESGSLGQVINNTSVVELPLNGRNFTQLATLTAGTLLGTPSGFGGSTVIGNGMRTSNVVFMQDGVNTTEQDSEGTLILPPPDAVQEFKVETNTAGADFGLGGMVVNVGLKSGTNSFHGNLYEYLRNDATDARNFFSTTVPALKQNQFGFTFGGPIKKDKTFFFGDYQGTRIIRGQTANNVEPSAAMRTGDFSSLKQALIDPRTQQPFPGNQIPASAMSPQAAYFLQYFPVPNTQNGTYLWNANATNDVDQFDIKIDHQLTNSNSIRATYSFMQPATFTPGALPANGAVTTALRHQVAGITDIQNFSPTVINSFTLGYMRVRLANSPQGLGTNYTVNSGIGGFAETSGPYPGFPQLNPTGYKGLTDNAFTPILFRENNYNLHEVLSIAKGKHLIEIGFDLTRHSNFTYHCARCRGEFTFTGVYTGNSFADYLLGIPYQGARSFPRDLFGYYMNEQEPYFLDNWKVTPRLTLTLGLRYSLIHQPFMSPDTMSSINPATNTMVVGSNSRGEIVTNAQAEVESLTLPYFKDIIVPSSKAGLDHTLRHPDYNNLAPRVGAAWQIGKGIVIRAAYGMFYSLYQGVQFEGLEGANPPFFADQLGIFNTTPVPTYTLANFFAPVSSSTYSLPPLTFYQIDPHSPIPYIQQWNFTLQKMIAGVVSVEAAYVGNKGTHLAFSEPVNVPLPGPGQIQSRRLNSTFAAGYLLQETDNSIYHALQMKAETRSWRNLSLISTFTWQKGLDYQYGDFQSSPPVQDPNCIKCERGPISIPAARFTLGTVYGLPFLKRSTGLKASLLGGWEVTTILSVQSGLPFTPSIDTDPANTGTPKRPNRISNGALSNPTVSRWFDVSAFAVPAPYTFGNSGVNILTGPGLFNWDFGLFKNFKIAKLGEQAHIQFRAEFFNLTNTPAFANPTVDIQSPAAGQVLSAGTPRELQFALKLFF